MRLQSLSGKWRQLRILPAGLWPGYIRGWLRRSQTGLVPLCFPHTDRLVWVPAVEFYESYSFFCESPHGMGEIGYLLSKLQDGDVLYDIGAFRGACGVAAKAALGDAIEAHLFEPLLKNQQAIQTIAASNRLSRFFLIPKAVGRGETLTGRVNTAEGMLRQGDADATPDSVEFPCVTLDRYVAESGTTPSVIKLDVDGFEFDVIEGGRATLEAARPSLWIEVHPKYLAAQGRDWKDLIALLETADYRIEYFEDSEYPSRDISFHIWASGGAGSTRR